MLKKRWRTVNCCSMIELMSVYNAPDLREVRARLRRGEVLMQQLNETPLSFPIRDQAVRGQLVSRRERITEALSGGRSPSLEHLLGDIDAALERLKNGTFGVCETCHDPIENDRILADPLCRNCLDHLSAPERRALERDLDLASQIQRGLLPKAPVDSAGWDLAFTYEPAGAVSGDYCDLIPVGEGGGLFMLGDVTGKGVAASMLMAQLHAIFRSLATVTTAVTALVEKANRVFCQSGLTSHFATLVCGRFNATGQVEICNAGHCLPLHVRRTNVVAIPSAGLPVGILCDGEYPSQREAGAGRSARSLHRWLVGGLQSPRPALWQRTPEGTAGTPRCLDRRTATRCSASRCQKIPGGDHR